jgi:diguanylate cyclase (GGDEF)-like protein
MRSIRFGDGIRSRLILLALIAAVPFIWYRVADIRAAETASLDAIRNEVMRIAAGGAADQAEVFAEAGTLLSIAAKVPVLTAGAPEACADFLHSIKASRDWAKNLIVLDPGGRVVCATDPKAIGLDLGDRSYFHAAVASRGFALSDTVVSRLDNQPILAAAYPAFAPDGTLQAVLVATLNRSWFDRATAAVGKMLNARVLLVDRQGTVLGRYPDVPQDADAAVVDQRIVQASTTAGPQSFEIKDDDGVGRLYGVAELGATHARLAVGVSIDTALAAARARIQSAYINAALLAFVIVLLAWLGGERVLLSPLRDLLATTRRLADGDLAARAQLRRGTREFRELAASFNIMADRLSELAITDGLTGVSNRRRFDQYLDEEWRRAMRTQTPISLAMIDIDGFKKFNDTHGHQAGDECLRMVASELTRFARRSQDLVGRYGGEEFVIGLPGLSAEDAKSHGERMRAAIAALSMPEIGVGPGDVTISVGMAVCVPSPGTAADTLVAMADSALYEAKREGRDRVALFRDEPGDSSTRAA